MKPIAIIGMPGSGKSTIGALVATEMGYGFADSDDELSKKHQISIAEMFEQFGESQFRIFEAEMLSILLSKPLDCGFVISFGGGSPIFNYELILSRCTFVYLTRSIEQIWQSISAAPGERPLAQSLANLERLYEQRRSAYKRLADITVANVGAPAKVAQLVVEELKKCGYS